MRVVISFILTTTFLFCGYSHNIHRPNNDSLAESASRITFYQKSQQSMDASLSSSFPNRVQSPPASSFPTGQLLPRVGGFENVFRWRQINFTPLDNGK